jgi:hypothetical protein
MVLQCIWIWYLNVLGDGVRKLATDGGSVG